MTPLRHRMIRDLQLRGYADRTIEAYVHAVAQLAKFYHASPDALTEEQIRDYLLHLSTVKKVARASHTIALCGIKFFYQQTLGREWTVLDVARPKREKKLPVVLSRDEVWRILDQVRIPVYRVCLTTIYACGLRLLEGTRLQVPDVDGDRKVLHIHGKGGKDRYVPLPDGTLSSCASTGVRVAIRSGSFPVGHAAMWRRSMTLPWGRSRAAAFRAPSCAP